MANQKQQWDVDIAVNALILLSMSVRPMISVPIMESFRVQERNVFPHLHSLIVERHAVKRFWSYSTVVNKKPVMSILFMLVDNIGITSCPPPWEVSANIWFFELLLSAFSCEGRPRRFFLVCQSWFKAKSFSYQHNTSTSIRFPVYTFNRHLTPLLRDTSLRTWFLVVW